MYFGTGSAKKSPSLDEELEIWMMSPWRYDLPPYTMHDGLNVLDVIFDFLQGNLLKSGVRFFNKETASIILLILV